MQSIGVFHRDLKLSNIILENDNNKIKIIDFGLAVSVGQNEQRDTFCGTPNYIAPEMIKNDKYDKRAEVWSLGCILYALYAGKPPFETKNVHSTLDKIQKGKYISPKNIGTDAKDLLSQMLQQDVSKRIKIGEILDHDFFEEFMALPTPDESNLRINFA